MNRSSMAAPRKLPSSYGRIEIAKLKEKYPSKIDWIDRKVDEYLDEGGPENDDEFVQLLRNALRSSLR